MIPPRARAQYQPMYATIETMTARNSTAAHDLASACGTWPPAARPRPSGARITAPRITPQYVVVALETPRGTSRAPET
jgi:hypothetical protein